MNKYLILIIFIVSVSSNIHAERISDVKELKTICEKMILSRIDKKYHKLIVSKSDQSEEVKNDFKTDLFTRIDEIMERSLGDSIDGREWIRDLTESFIILSCLSKNEGKYRYIQMGSLYLSANGSIHDLSLDNLVMLETARLYLSAKENDFNEDNIYIKGYFKNVDKIFDKYGSQYSKLYKDYLKIKDLIKK